MRLVDIISFFFHNYLEFHWLVEFGRKGVRVNSILPGTIKTDIFKTVSAFKNKEEEEKFYEMESGRTCLGTVGDAGDIATTIIHLAELSRFTNGALIRIDGGRHLLVQ